MRVRVLMGVGGLEPRLEEFGTMELPAEFTIHVGVGAREIPVKVRLEEAGLMLPPPPLEDPPPAPLPPGVPPPPQGGDAWTPRLVNRAA